MTQKHYFHHIKSFCKVSKSLKKFWKRYEEKNLKKGDFSVKKTRGQFYGLESKILLQMVSIIIWHRKYTRRARRCYRPFDGIVNAGNI